MYSQGQLIPVRAQDGGVEFVSAEEYALRLGAFSRPVVPQPLPRYNTQYREQPLHGFASGRPAEPPQQQLMQEQVVTPFPGANHPGLVQVMPVQNQVSEIAGHPSAGGHPQHAHNWAGPQLQLDAAHLHATAPQQVGCVPPGSNRSVQAPGAFEWSEEVERARPTAVTGAPGSAPTASARPSANSTTLSTQPTTAPSEPSSSRTESTVGTAGHEGDRNPSYAQAASGPSASVTGGKKEKAKSQAGAPASTNASNRAAANQSARSSMLHSMPVVGPAARAATAAAAAVPGDGQGPTGEPEVREDSRRPIFPMCVSVSKIYSDRAETRYVHQYRDEHGQAFEHVPFREDVRKKILMTSGASYKTPQMWKLACTDEGDSGVLEYTDLSAPRRVRAVQMEPGGFSRRR